MIGRYKDEEAVKKRVKKLRTIGINTGYRVFEDGSASPLYDPDDFESDTARHDRKADE
jgi:hypothetical protein